MSNCIRCGDELTDETCDPDYIETGICAYCWLDEDEEDE